MNFPFYIARRYLFSKKGSNAVNIITWVSVIGVAVGAMGLVIVLSVFNGFQGLIQSLYNSFDPDLKVIPIEGKYFEPSEDQLQKAYRLESIEVVSEVLEEKALLRYKDQEYIATIKGVDDAFTRVSGIDSMLLGGIYFADTDYPDRNAIIGQGVSYYLSLGIDDMFNPVNVYVPKGDLDNTFDMQNAFTNKQFYSVGVFSIQADYDEKYVITTLRFARELLDLDKQVSAIEIKLVEGANTKKVQKQLQEIFGNDFEVLNRYQQHAVLYKVMNVENRMIYFIFTLILLIATFSIVGSLTMLILDKKNDIKTLWNVGLSIKEIKKVFLTEGLLITFFGAFIGIGLGVLIGWLQQTFGFVKLGSGGNYVVNAYPVEVHALDALLVLTTVVVLGYLASKITVMRLSNSAVE